MEPKLSQALHLLNGDATTQRIRQGGLIGKRLAEKKTPDQIIEELYLRTLVRRPSPTEMERLRAALKDEPDKAKGWKTSSGRC